MVSEHRSHRLRCPCCNRRTAAGFPAAVADSAFGPRLQAAVLTLTARNRISRRDMSELARELFGIGLSVGAVDAICRRGSIALAEPHEALVASVLGSPAVNVDETGWVTAGNDRTLWTATTPEAAIFRIAADRHRDRLQELLGERFAGICCSDRWWAYNQIDPESRQACWSHLQRDFRFHAEGLPTQKHFGEHGLELTSRLFQAWHGYQRTPRPRPARTRDRPGHIAGAKVSDRRHPVELAVASFVPPAAAAVARVVSVETHGVERTGQRVRHGGGAGRVCVPATASKPSSSVLLRRRRSSRAGCYRRFPTSTAARAALGLAAEEIGWLWSLFGDPITSIRRADRSVFSDGAHRLHALRVAGVERVVVCTCDETDG